MIFLNFISNFSSNTILFIKNEKENLRYRNSRNLLINSRIKTESFIKIKLVKHRFLAFENAFFNDQKKKKKTCIFPLQVNVTVTFNINFPSWISSKYICSHSSFHEYIVLEESLDAYVSFQNPVSLDRQASAIYIFHEPSFLLFFPFLVSVSLLRIYTLFSLYICLQ